MEVYLKRFKTSLFSLVYLGSRPHAALAAGVCQALNATAEKRKLFFFSNFKKRTESFKGETKSRSLSLKAAGSSAKDFYQYKVQNSL